MNNIKTGILMATLAGALMVTGSLIGGQNGLTVAFFMALIMNGIMYFFSDRIVLSLYGAKPLDKNQYPEIHSMVKELTTILYIPIPKLWIIETPVANAFATGRNPQHSSVAFTTGILQILDRHELRGVIAHELSHIVNRDIFVTTLAATFAAAIGYLANFSQHALLWGHATTQKNKNNSIGIMGYIATIILMPLIATLVRLGISRSREYLADSSGAQACQDPLALASALKKLSAHTKHASFSSQDATKEATAGLFIVRPFSSESTLMELLSTHPPLAKRVAALEKMHLNAHRWDM